MMRSVAGRAAFPNMPKEPAGVEPAGVEPAGTGREDRIGLGIAIAAHVALFAALAFWEDRPEPVPEPQRIVVTMSEEIALESVSPNPMANPAASVAPELGNPVPAPVPPGVIPDPAPPIPELRSQTRPQPAPPVPPTTRPRPEPRAPAPPRTQPKPTPRPEPRRPEPRRAAPQRSEAPRAAPSRSASKPAESQRAEAPAPSRASRLGSDFLAGTGGSGQDAEQPAQRAGPLTAASLASAISRQLRPNWTAPQGADAEKLVTILSWEMNRDGSLKGRPQIVSQTGITDANRAQQDRHAELAIRAVQLAAPFDLPPELYDSWRRVSDFRFDRRL